MTSNTAPAPATMPTTAPTTTAPATGPATTYAGAPPAAYAPVIAAGRELLDLVAGDPSRPLCAGVVAPAGYGKSALLAALAERYAAAGVPVVTGRTDDPGDGAAALLVDDAHLLDDRRLRELRELAAGPGARMVLAYRPWPRPAALADLVEELRRHRLPLALPPLSAAQVGAYLTAAGVPPVPGLAGFVTAQTRGVPRFVARLTAALAGTRLAAVRPAPGGSPRTGTPSRPVAAPQPGAAPPVGVPRQRAMPILPPAAVAPFAADLDGLDPDVRLTLLAVEAGVGLHLDLVGALLERDADGVAELMAAARATGLLWPDGTLVPLAQHAVAALEPLAHRVRVRQRLAALQLARGGPVLPLVRPLLAIGRAAPGRPGTRDGSTGDGGVPARDAAGFVYAAGADVAGTGAVGLTDGAGTGTDIAGTGAAVVGVGGDGMAAAFDAAGREALREDPALAARLFAEATAAGQPAAARRAMATALAGDLESAARLADQVVAAGDSAERPEAAYVAAVALAHRGQVARGVEMFGWAPPGPAAGFAVVGLVGTGQLTQARRYAHPHRPGIAPDGPPTLLASAASLMARGVHESVTGSPTAALSTLVQAATLLEPAGAAVLLPDSPAALAALVGLHCAEFDTAAIMLERAVEAGTGGPLLRTRHRLLQAWLLMVRGTLAVGGERGPATGDPARFSARDRLFAAALRVGQARRASDLGALRNGWPEACQAIVGHPVDLFTMLPLGELAIAAARLGDQRRLVAHLTGAETMLGELGNPPLWSVPLHWSRLHAAVIAEQPAEAERHATALAGLREHGPYPAATAAAAQCWLDVLDGRVDPEAVEEAAHGLAALGLAWDGARLAGQAAIRTTDRPAMTTLLDCARLLQGRRVAVPGAPAGRGSGGGCGPDAGRGARYPAPVPERTLSERERQVAELVLAGLTYKQVGDRLYISAKTVEHHMARMRQRLGCTDRRDLLTRLRELTVGDGGQAMRSGAGNAPAGSEV